MRNKGALALRVLLNRFHSGAPEKLLESLPQEESEHVSSLQTTSRDISAILPLPEQWVQQIHYSWHQEAIKTLPQDLKEWILCALPEPCLTKLSDLLSLKPADLKLSPPVRDFLLQVFYLHAHDPEVTPLKLLPVTPMTPLARLGKANLIKLTDFLGLHDLAGEMRRIVDRELLEKFKECLTRKEKLFLKSYLYKKEKLVAQRMNLMNWDGNGQSLRRLIHKRGLTRLGHALTGQDPDLVLHIARTLDVGRGKLLIERSQHDVKANVVQALIKQVLALIKELNLKE